MTLKFVVHCVNHLGTVFVMFNVFLARENVFQRIHTSDESGIKVITMHSRDGTLLMKGIGRCNPLISMRESKDSLEFALFFL